MRSTAEAKGRNPRIAEGMVDEKIVVKDVDDDSTKLISLTAEEALKFSIADFIVENPSQLLSNFSLENASIITLESNWAEDFVRFLNNPIISSLLIMIGFFGLFAEIKTPGWGLPGTIGVIALALFFGSSYILQLASIIEILLFVIGLILLALEIFVIPGFGIAGIAGIILIVVSLFLSLLGADFDIIDADTLSTAIIQLTAALVLSLVGIFFLARILPKTSFFSRLILAEEANADKGFVSYPTISELVGAEGIALTTLRPAGTAEFNGQRVDVVADWEYIERGAKIKVLRVEGIKVVVKEIKS